MSQLLRSLAPQELRSACSAPRPILWDRRRRQNRTILSPIIALIAYEQQPAVVLHTPAPGRPALNGKINPIVVGVGPSQNLCALVVRRGGETDMRALGN